MGNDRHDNTPTAAPTDAVPDDPAEGLESTPEVPGGPQVDVPAATGNVPEEHDDERSG
jgi:hypothetical protein